ncbi:2-oxoglutarate dehydrogenase E2 component (dihydrolipoamide succinyltransferase) [Catalinimonas alkaloidigena]|uniref:dihydrolipoamide acetyltransferase family protein n=1 Tax=Catalinimonas alkaloidigena TaxID=1075417 RepID=UPI0024075D3A|nr:dihydrolipoamide acetyltransferase family protein [Catalinimonas alkaloidigena]MDF9797355.1 2-oxoglutarate dehydrogenase E2 component (dihydrolipoamide succinyltransferase) [Catalinimonas alkaloidigena]
MATFEMVMPRMGESIMEGTILKWLKAEGEFIEQDESVLEVATDKVDTEVPATHSGVLKKILIQEGEIAKVGKVIAIIENEANNGSDLNFSEIEPKEDPTNETIVAEKPKVKDASSDATSSKRGANQFYSPLVRNIAKEENISEDELQKIEGSGKDGRVTKKDIIQYLESRKQKSPSPTLSKAESVIKVGPNDEIIEMDRMRKMIANRMLESKEISAHVSSFVEADVTNIVTWRNKYKKIVKEREGEPFTFMPIFIEAIAQAIKDFPLINVSVDDHRIIKRKDINIGMAVALKNGNLIVPVIKNADQLSLLGLTKKVNELANKARNNQLTADDLSEGTYTISNIGSFGNLMGTPIIMQPQVAILALGSIVKKPSVIETPAGDAIGIRHKMFLSHSYDHRVVDGALGGMFVKRVADLLESFDTNRVV